MKNLFYSLIITALIFSGCSKSNLQSSESSSFEQEPDYISQSVEDFNDSNSLDNDEFPNESVPEQQPVSEPSPNSFPLVGNSTNGSPPIYNSFFYYSVEELINGISSGISNEIYNEIRISDKTRGDILESFITSRRSQNSIYVPFINGEMFNCKTEIDRIIFCPVENYNRSWISYQFDKNPIINDTPMIDIMYLDTILNSSDIKTANEKGASWLMNKINPNGENSEKQYPVFDESYVKEISLADRKTEAVFTIIKCDWGNINQTYFVYDDVLVKIRVNMKNVEEEWLKSLSFKPVPLK